MEVKSVDQHYQAGVEAYGGKIKLPKNIGLYSDQAGVEAYGGKISRSALAVLPRPLKPPRHARWMCGMTNTEKKNNILWRMPSDGSESSSASAASRRLSLPHMPQSNSQTSSPRSSTSKSTSTASGHVKCNAIVSAYFDEEFSTMHLHGHKIGAHSLKLKSASFLVRESAVSDSSKMAEPSPSKHLQSFRPHHKSFRKKKVHGHSTKDLSFLMFTDSAYLALKE
eukprot:2979256-Rhodomonas_salina.1